MKQTIIKSPLVYVVLILGLLAVGLGFWLLSSSYVEQPVQHEQAGQQQKTPDAAPLKDSVELVEVPVSAAPQVAGIEPSSADNPFLEVETKARLIQIADSFAEDVQYPVYSKPIRNQDELQKYLPNTTVADSVPLDAKNENSPRVSLKTSKLQYFSGEPIQAVAFVEGQLSAQSVQVEARLVMHGQLLSQTEAEPVESAQHRFQIHIDPATFEVASEMAELRLIASFDIDGEHYEIGSPVKYVRVSSAIDYVASPEVVDSVLQIPVFVTTSAPGFHQLSAILYNAENGQPLIHLNAEKELLVERDFIPLQAHIAAFKASGHEGPYLLKDFSLTRMPSEPDYTTRYGSVPSEAVQLDGFSFSDYRDEPYIDEQAQERVEFLKKLGGEV